jgi:hypothetical protein
MHHAYQHATNPSPLIKHQASKSCNALLFSSYRMQALKVPIQIRSMS